MNSHDVRTFVGELQTMTNVINTGLFGVLVTSALDVN